MKLSEMNTTQLSVCLCRIAAPLERIGKSETVNAYFEGVAKAKESSETMFSRLTGMFGALIPVLLDVHRDDTFTILSALTGKTIEEIENQNGMQTIREIRECFDGDLLVFFKQSGASAAGE